MTQPLRLNQPEIAFPVERPAPPPYATDIVHGEQDRFGVPAKGWALLVLVDRLSKVTGFCYMSQRRLAPQIGVKPRQFRNIQAMLVDKGHLGIRHPRGLPPTLWVKSWPAPVANAGGGGNGLPPPVAMHCHPGGGNPLPPNIQRDSTSSAGDAPRRRAEYWKPALRIGPDAPDLPLQLSRAVRDGRVLYTSRDGRRRRIVRCTHNASFATLFLTDEHTPDAPPAEVRVPAAEVGKLIFWR